jgi:O-antigen ligase
MKVSVKLKGLQKIAFQLLVVMLPTQLGKHFWPEWSKIFGIRVDYLSPTIYLTDILVGTMFILWIIEHLAFSSSLRGKISKIPLRSIILIFTITLFAFLNTKYSLYPKAALLKWIKVLELIFVVGFTVSRKEFRVKSWLLKPMLLSLTYVALLIFLQIYFQRSINGVFYYLGERNFNAYSSSIALVSVFGKELLRPYSTFSHPNSLAGFLAVVFMLFWVKRDFLIKGKFLVSLILMVLMIMTFSLNILVTVVVLTAMVVVLRKKKSIFIILVNIVFWTTVVLSVALPIVGYSLKENIFSESYDKRFKLSIASGEMIEENLFIGTGLNNFFYHLPSTSIKPQTTWWLQPVHNIYLLVFVETGILGLLLFIYIVKKAIVCNFTKMKLEESRYILLMTLLVIVLTGFNDHYWLTLQQNQLLFSIVLGLSFREKLY